MTASKINVWRRSFIRAMTMMEGDFIHDKLKMISMSFQTWVFSLQRSPFPPSLLSCPPHHQTAKHNYDNDDVDCWCWYWWLKTQNYPLPPLLPTPPSDCRRKSWSRSRWFLNTELSPPSSHFQPNIRLKKKKQQVLKAIVRVYINWEYFHNK